MRHDEAWVGVAVRLRDNPGRLGMTTGRVTGEGERLRVEVRFGPHDIVFKHAAVLERESPTPLSPLERLERGELGTPMDLRRLLTFQKVRGQLTNVLYSMESSNTDFYPHQFKPVLKFLDSTDGRLLIADEVGLGKTIEAMYIWKELEAREQAQRLLVVCPAMLQEKWRGDLRQRFNIRAEVLHARDLKERLDDAGSGGSRAAFVAITSLEGLRPDPNWEDESNPSVRAQIARLLDRTPAAEDAGLLDLVIIDEAHYLRNPSTASNRLARLLRDAARHLVLLTATPIQLNNDNLYQLLRLISPQVFFLADVFTALLEANKPLVAAQRHLWALPPDIAAAGEALGRALASPYFARDVALHHVQTALGARAALDEDTRVRLGHKLESASLLGQYLTRTRKRDVIIRRVERRAITIKVQLTNLERDLYKRISLHLRQRAHGARGVALFVEIARQRRMASCMVAALQAWRETGDLEELLWDDLGVSAELDDTADTVRGGENPDDAAAAIAGGVDYLALERMDSKYAQLFSYLRELLARNPGEKVVIFAFFRGTLAYLRRRLADDGIRVGLIQGGMGDEKWDVLDVFRSPDGPSVLLSSEVGSEGIDLQFARFLVNYDLPWNPMKVEQRIGRIDRLGQAAERIFIVNLVLEDTVEDRILERLYHRIGIFRESLGDLEDILGRTTEQLMVDAFLRDLTDDEIRQREEQIALALAQNRQQRERLEHEAINLMAFSDYILAQISRTRSQGRWLQPTELRRFVEDFLVQRYPGSVLRPHDTREAAFILTLSDPARNDFQAFMARYDGPRATELHRAGTITCFFDPKQAGVMGRRLELLDQTHPAIRWIASHYEAEPETFFPVTASRIPASAADVPPGQYGYCAQLREFVGLRRESTIAFKVASVVDNRLVGDEASERLVVAAAHQGHELPNAANRLDIARVTATARRCVEALLTSCDQALEEFRAENEQRCNVHEESARQFHERRVTELRERIERFRHEGKASMIPPTEGLIRMHDDELELKLRRIAEQRTVDETMQFLAVGVIDVS
ncbi:MAG: DEAD/DEAH box helicase [Candidatus Rokubacteria bacterium]|nr:DEAD/DEAH box helicase [Candidatus Rokubacteria bacterium]MBI3108852.1 DEAD/DEAH box helicase [Candidatus Rokubacteria bacterium]